MHEHTRKNVILIVTTEVSGLSEVRIDVSKDGRMGYFHCVKDGKRRAIAFDIADPYAFLITGRARDEFSIAAEIIYELSH